MNSHKLSSSPLKWIIVLFVFGSLNVAAAAPRVSGTSSLFAVAISTAPNVTVTTPLSGAVVTGTVTLTATVYSDAGVASVQFYANGAAIGNPITTYPYSLNWDTAKIKPGAYNITALALDKAGNQTLSAAVPVSIPDVTRPVITLTAPVAGATLTGTATLLASATDNVRVAGVQFYANGTALGNEVTVSPYSTLWDTTRVTPGTYSITARARDAAGNQSTTPVVSVTVPDQTGPNVMVTAPLNGASGTGMVTLTVNVFDSTGVQSVQFYANGTAVGAPGTASPYSVVWNTSKVAGGTYSITAQAWNKLGKQGVSPAVTFTVVPDTTPPSVSMTAPSNGSSISGKVALAATASDNVGVVGVQFLVNSTAVGAEVRSPPYSMYWDTTGVSNGSGYVVRARARDAAGNQTTSSGVTTTVYNPIPHSAILNWAASASPVIGYYVYRATQTGGPYSRVSAGINALTTFTDNSVANGQTLFYVVTAVDSNNVESGYSSETVATIPQ